MPLSFLWSAQVSDVFVPRLPLLSFFRFQVLARAVEDAVRFLVVVFLDVALVLVVVVVVAVTLVLAATVVAVNAILLAVDKVLIPHAQAPTPTVALAVVALFFS